MVNLKVLERQEHSKSETNGKKLQRSEQKLMKLRLKKIQRIRESKSWFFERIGRIWG